MDAHSQPHKRGRKRPRRLDFSGGGVSKRNEKKPVGGWGSIMLRPNSARKKNHTGGGGPLFSPSMQRRHAKPQKWETGEGEEADRGKALSQHRPMQKGVFKKRERRCSKGETRSRRG